MKLILYIYILPRSELESAEQAQLVHRSQFLLQIMKKLILLMLHTAPQTKDPKSVSIGDLLRAGKLVRPPQKKAQNLEMFDVENCKWVKSSVLSVEIEETKFDSGAFRDAF